MSESVGFADFVAARQDALLRTAWLLAGDWQSAEDLVQTVLMKMWPRWERVTQAGDPEAYVRRALLTTYLTWRRRRWYGERAVAVIPDVVVPGDPLAATDLRVALARLLPSLPTRQRAVLVLRYYEDLSETQTADLLGCSVGTSQS